MANRHDRIAIVGLDCRFPGAEDTAAFWRMLAAGEHGLSTATAAHYGAPPAAFHDPSGTRTDTSPTLRGGFLDAHAQPTAAADLPREGHRVLATARNALNGHAPQRTGLVLGTLTLPTASSSRLYSALYAELLASGYAARLGRDGLALPLPDGAGSVRRDTASGGLLAAMLAETLGLGGPLLALDAACASSVYALALAAWHLQAGHADVMLAGAVSGADPLVMNLGFARLGGHPDEGHASLPLDANSGGLVVSEGAAIVALKRLADARRDGDTIHAVLRGIGLSNDGHGKHPLTPNSRGQRLAIERAYADAGLSPSAVRVVECHASGTSLGDRTELRTLADFYGPTVTPESPLLLGSVKANVGHLMTASGMAGLFKLILAMQQGVLPPTPGVSDPLPAHDGLFPAATVPAAPVPWPDSPGQPRRAALDSFGFGGVSAHLILESQAALEAAPAASYSGESVTRLNQNTEPTTMTDSHNAASSAAVAITGMSAHFGPLDGLDAFARAIYNGEAALVALPETRWNGLDRHPEVLARLGFTGEAPRGAYIEGFDFDFAAFKIPPNPADEPVPQQLLMLKVADAAIRDAGLQPGANAAVIVALDPDPTLHRARARADLNWQIDALLNDASLHLDADQRAELARIGKDALLPPAEANRVTSMIGNITASRIAAHWDFTGPAFTVSGGENGVFRALETAALMLARGEVEAVVVGAVDLAGSPERVLLAQSAAKLNDGPTAAGFDAANDGWTIGEGAGALVLTRADATAPAYATLDALNIASAAPVDDAPSAETVGRAARGALQAAGLDVGAVGYLEAQASGIPTRDAAEITGLSAVYRGATPQTAVGSAASNLGLCGAASGMAALIRAALAVADRFLPAMAGWSQPELPEAWQGSAFWVAHRSRTWFDTARHAAVNSLGADGSAAHAILSAPAANTRRSPAHVYLRNQPPYLFPLAGYDAADFQHKLAMLAAAIDDGDLQATADATYANFRHISSAPYVLALVGKDADSLRREIERAAEGVPQAIAGGTAWSTPAGSAFSAQPVGESGHVAYVYPGAFNSYPKLGYDLFAMFPGAYDALNAVRSDMSAGTAERLLYPRTLAKPGPRDTNRMKTALGDDPVAMIESGLAFATVYTHIMREVFRVPPKAAFGYSLGEGSMLWGMGVWRDGDAGSAAFRASDLFRTRLTGPMNAVREAWGIGRDVAANEFWAAYFISAPVAAVEAAVKRESRVFLTHINTPNECMIAGDPAACYRVVEAVGGEAVRAPFSVVIHADVMMSEYNAYYRLHHLPVQAVEGVTFYSAADYAPMTLQQDAVAASIARMACKPVDFARLVERAYADGARVFIELGPRSTCARWIDETLGDRPHHAASIDVLGADGRVSLVKLLASLVAQRVPVDLSPLYREGQAAAPVNGRSLVRRVTLGGADIIAAIAGESAAFAAPAAKTAPTAGAASAPAAGAASAPALADAAVHAVHNAHTVFLDMRRDALRGLGEMVQMQMGSTTSAPPAPVPAAEPPPPALPPVPAPEPVPAPSVAAGITPMYDRHAIETFATGRIADCFGPLYAIYDNRRAPRIPNGDLLLVSRAVTITGERFKSVAGTAIHAEYDVPADMWFYRDNPYPVMPYSVYMEIALQPCGFLSAYHGPTLDYPEIDFYFRNLDGVGRLHTDRDMRGRTITNHVTLTGSTVLQGIIIQKYTFALYDGDTLFYDGEASFGYFTREALNSQAGLDAGQRVPRWIDEAQPDPAQIIEVDPHAAYGSGYLQLAGGKLGFTDAIRVVPGGGRHGQGYAYANTVIDPAAWYFKNHFHEDPVMPGSIGLETVLQAMQAYAIATGLADDFAAPRFAQVDGPLVGREAHTTSWKYRGQILSSSEKSHVEANIKQVIRQPGQVVLIADASLWRDDLRIYAATDIALAIVEA